MGATNNELPEWFNDGLASCCNLQTLFAATAQPDATCNKFLHGDCLTMHCILRRDPEAPAHT